MVGRYGHSAQHCPGKESLPEVPKNRAHGPGLPRTWLMHNVPASRPSSHVPWPPLQETESTATINVGKRNVFRPSIASVSLQSKPVCIKCCSSAHPDCASVEQRLYVNARCDQLLWFNLVTTLGSNKDRRGGRRQYPSYSRPLHRQSGH